MKGKTLNLSASLEDYLEAILEIAGENKVARGKDIAKLLNVTKPSVTGALQVLAKKGLVNYQPYDYVTLTDSGMAEAARITKKHDIIKSFFVDILGVDSDLAQRAACKAEHALGPEVVSKLLDFTDFINEMSQKDTPVAVEFKHFGRKKANKTIPLKKDKRNI